MSEHEKFVNIDVSRRSNNMNGIGKISEKQCHVKSIRFCGKHRVKSMKINLKKETHDNQCIIRKRAAIMIDYSR